MTDIVLMAVLGLIAGTISGFWTRIIKRKMIFESFGKWLQKKDESRLILYSTHNPWVYLMRCIFCFSVWCCFILDAFYIIDERPFWVYAIIGVFASLGVGNFIAEIICSTRSDE